MKKPPSAPESPDELDESQEVEASETAPPTGPPTVSEVAHALDAEETTVETVYAAERAAQASVCNLPAADAEWPPELVEALTARVGVALITGPRTGSTDPEVKRLEEDHRKRVPATVVEPT